VEGVFHCLIVLVYHIVGKNSKVVCVCVCFRLICGRWAVVWKRFPQGLSTKSTSSSATCKTY